MKRLLAHPTIGLLTFGLILFACSFIHAQNVRYSVPFPSISSTTVTPYLVANIPPSSPVLAVCNSPANQVPCTNYATTYTSSGAACANGSQDTPDPQPSSCQAAGDAQGNIGFWAAPGKYDYTVCIRNSTSCFGPYTVTLAASATLFVQTADATVGNTTNEQTLTAAGVGSLTLSPNFLTAGRVLHISGAGYFANTGNPTQRVRIYLGSTAILDTTANAGFGITGTSRGVTIDVILTCRSIGSSGTVTAGGWVAYGLTHNTWAGDDFTPLTSPVAIDTTVAQTVNLTFQWGTANSVNTITLTNLVIRAY